MTMMTLFSCILIYFVVGIGIETNAQVLHRDSYYCLPKKCLKNQFFILCDSTNSAKPGKDECIPCKNGTFNLNEMDTSTLTYHLQVPEYEVCTKPDCNCGPEGLLVNGHNCNINGAQKICICNVNEGYCGDDYRNCDKWNKAESDIPVDWGLTQNCSIKKCEEGYSKPYVGYGACEEDTNNSTTTQPTTPFTSGASTTDVQNNSTEVDTTTPSVNEDKDGGLDLNILIIVVLSLIVIVVIIVVVAIIYRRRRGRHNANPGDEDEEESL